jgi:outer membrane receptor protein involved in Fe transport
LEPLSYNVPNPNGSGTVPCVTADNTVPGSPLSCKNSPAYTRYNQITGATVTQTNGGGISPFAVFGFDAAYTLPTPTLPVLKKVTFDLNVQNLFDNKYFQYFYYQVSPANCAPIKTGKFAGLPANNYSCTPAYSDGIPAQPFSVFFTVTARF